MIEKHENRFPSPRRKRLVLKFPTNIEATAPPRIASYISSFLHMLHDVDLKPPLEIVVFCDNLPFSGMPQNQVLASLYDSIRRQREELPEWENATGNTPRTLSPYSLIPSPFNNFHVSKDSISHGNQSVN